MGRRRKIAFDPNGNHKGKGLRRGKISVDNDNQNLTPTLTFYPSLPAGEQYVIISDSNTTHGRSTATATPVFWGTGNMLDSSLLEIINGLPDRVNQPDFTDASQAVSWLLDSNKYYLISPQEGNNHVVDDLVVYLDPANRSSWPGYGSKIYDLSGNENHATLYNGPVIGDGYITFDGSNDYLQIPYNSSMATWNTEQTVMIWLNHTYTSGRRNPWDQAYGGYGTWTHEQGNNISHYFGDAGQNGSPYVGRGSSTTNRGVWNCMATTRTTSNSKWYKNGVLHATWGHSYNTLTNDTNTVHIGKGYAGYWQGKMGKIMVYDKALTSEELLKNYYGGNIVTRNLQLYYDFNHFACYEGGTTINNLADPEQTPATINNTGNDITFSQAGYLEWAGSNAAYIDINDTTQMGNFSLSAWVYNKSGGNSRHSLLRNFWEIVGTSLQFWSYDFANDYWRSTASNVVPYDTWTYITTVWNGSVIKHYINGELVWTDSSTSSGTSENMYWIGGYGGRKFKGKLGTIAIYTDDLTASEVKQNYEAHKLRFQ